MVRLGSLRREMKKLRKSGLIWQEIADRYGVTVGMAYRIAVNGYEPKEAAIRVRLGLPARVLTPVCMSCGQVHVSKRCTVKAAARRYRDLWDMPVRALRKMLEERE